MKMCSKCRTTKPPTEFHANRKRKDGLNCWCKRCKSDYHRETHDPEKDRLYRKEHSAEIKAAKRLYYLRNAEKENARVAAWNAAHPDRRRETIKRYEAKGIPRDKAKLQAWLAVNRERRREQNRQRARVDREAAGPAYAAKVLGVAKTSASPELLAMKGEQLQVYRLVARLKRAVEGETQ